MKTFLREIVPDFGKKLLYDISKWAVLGLAIPIALGVWAFVKYIEPTFITGILLGFFLGGIFWLFTLLFLASFNKSEFNPLDDELTIDPHYRILEQENIYRHLSRTKLQYVRKLKLKIMRDNVDRFVGKYNWTGTGNCDISVTDPAQELIKTKRKEMFQIYEVKFSGICAKDDEVDIEIKMELDDSDRMAVPMFSHTVTDLTDKLMMRIIFPEDVKIAKKVMKSAFSHVSAKKPFESSSEDIQFRECSWVVNNPKLYQRYLIQWNWKE